MTEGGGRQRQAHGQRRGRGMLCSPRVVLVLVAGLLLLSARCVSLFGAGCMCSKEGEVVEGGEGGTTVPAAKERSGGSDGKLPALML